MSSSPYAHIATPSILLRNDLNRASIAALVFLIYDIALTLDSEVRTIWSRPNNAWIKWLFLFMRYFSLAIGICNRVVDMAVALDYPLSIRSLRVWFLSQVFVAWFAMGGIEFVLMARVYALYYQRLWVKAVFATLILGQFLVILIGLVMSLRSTRFTQLWDFVTKTPDSFVFLGIASLISQTTILILTILKYVSAIRGGWARIPIMKLMVRDGSLAFGFLLVLSMLIIIYTLFEFAFGALGYAWLLSIVSVAGCRLILNLQELPLSPTTLTPTAALQLTTVFSGAYTPC